MKLTECPACHAPVRTVTVPDDTDPTRSLELDVEPRPSLHGTIRILDLATGQGEQTDRGPGRYRPHYETCQARA